MLNPRKTNIAVGFEYEAHPRDIRICVGGLSRRRIAPEAAEARQPAVRSGAKATGNERVAGCQSMRPFTDAGSISLLL
jgi:hypothetical protein